MKIYTDIIQGTPEWHAVRCGKVTASRFSDVLAKGEGKTRLSYMKQLRAEKLTGLPEDSYTNSAMQWGTDHEAEARQEYANQSGNEIVPVGFAELNEWVGCSPDGLVGDDGLVEIKCPNTETHLDYIEANKCPSGYYAQIQGQMWITGRQWCDFVSFDPRVKVAPYFCFRCAVDKVYVKALEVAVNKFVIELNEMIDRISKFKGEF